MCGTGSRSDVPVLHRKGRVPTFRCFTGSNKMCVVTSLDGDDDDDDDDFIELMREQGERESKRARTEKNDQDSERMPPPPPRTPNVDYSYDLGKDPFRSFGLDLVFYNAIEATIEHRSMESTMIESVKLEILDEDKMKDLNRRPSEIKAVWLAHGIDWPHRSCVILRGIAAATLAPFVMAALYASKPSISKIVFGEYFQSMISNEYKNPFTDSFVGAAEKESFNKREREIRDLTNALDVRVALKYVTKLANMYEKRRMMKPIFDRGNRFDNHIAYLSEEIGDVEDALMKLYVYKVHIDSWSAIFKDDKCKIGPIVSKIRNVLRDRLVESLKTQFA